MADSLERGIFQYGVELAGLSMDRAGERYHPVGQDLDSQMAVLEELATLDRRIDMEMDMPALGAEGLSGVGEETGGEVERFLVLAIKDDIASNSGQDGPSVRLA